MFVSGYSDALYVAHPRAATDVWLFDELGLDVVTPDVPVADFWEILSWEQVGRHSVDLILNDVRGQAITVEQLKAQATFAALPAVQVGQVAPWYFEAVYSYRRPLFLLVLVAALVMTACGQNGSTARSATPSSAPSPGSSARGFPVTIKHALGSTTITSEPQRVVTIGWSDQDPVLALGVTPVGTTEWFNEQTGAIFPWARAAAGNAKPEIVATAGEINYEKVASVRPDLILALYEGLDQNEYDLLSQIAPTVAHSPDFDPFGATWQDMTLTAGRALGREQQAKDLIKNVEARFAKVRTEHPEWAQQTMLVMATVDKGTYQVFSPQDPKMRFFANLGFKTTPPWISGRVKDNLATVSAEEASLLDVDRLTWTSDPDTLEQLRDDPIYNRLDVVQDGRVSYLDYTQLPFPGAAVTFNTVLSIPYALDLVVPALEKGS